MKPATALAPKDVLASCRADSRACDTLEAETRSACVLVVLVAIITLAIYPANPAHTVASLQAYQVY
jgi:hypothetical protein